MIPRQRPAELVHLAARQRPLAPSSATIVRSEAVKKYPGRRAAFSATLVSSSLRLDRLRKFLSTVLSLVLWLSWVRDREHVGSVSRLQADCRCQRSLIYLGFCFMFHLLRVSPVQCAPRDGHHRIRGVAKTGVDLPPCHDFLRCLGLPSHHRFCEVPQHRG